MDANFRLKNQLVSSFSSDPGLGIGMAYMVPREGYDAYVLSRASDEDVCFHLIPPPLRPNNCSDQYVCGLSSPGKGQLQVFTGAQVHGRRGCFVRSLGDGSSKLRW